MDTQVPLNVRESDSLEFKAAAALRSHFSISREVVAMLNARGGEVWIGLREAGGVATAVDAIPEIERARGDLLNHLVEVVEPRLHVPGDVEIERVDHEGGGLLRVKVNRPGARGPFAQLKDGGRHFLLRVDNRIRPMTREEIFSPRPGGEDERGAKRLPGLRDEILRRDRPGLWVGIEPAPAVHLDTQAGCVTGYLQEPARSGNRAAGWSFSYPAYLGMEPRLRAHRIELGRESHRQTTVWEDGCVEFWAAMDALHHGTDSRPEIPPLALLEYPVSITRLAAALFGDRQAAPTAPRDVFVDVVLARSEGWRLPAYAPGTYGHLLDHEAPEALEEGRFVLSSPFRFSWEEFRAAPDHAGYMLVRSVYQAFHLPEDRIPQQYDRAGRRLLLRD
ncbi:MAG: ATP-binding protein [Planctomycetota bacterium]